MRLGFYLTPGAYILEVWLYVTPEGAMQDGGLSIFSGCFLVVYGIPASGKTLLTHKILQYGCRKLPEWNWLSIHFDNFYPPDTRATKVVDIYPHYLHIHTLHTFDKLSTLLDMHIVHAGGCRRII